MNHQTTDQAVPLSRRQLREALAHCVQPSTPLALAWCVLDLGVFAAASVAVAAPLALGWKVILSVLLALQIARLFVLGHDACHQALTPHRKLNRWLGRLVFLPSLTAYSLWELGHNQAHHSFTNLRGRDGVWVPYSPQEYQALPRHQQCLQRMYRCGWAPGLYYVVELWWKKLFFARPEHVGGERPVFVRDSRLVACFAVVWAAALATAASWWGQSVLQTWLFGLLLPWLGWSTVMGFVIYVHHTEPDVAWFDDGSHWAAAQPWLSTTLHVQAPVLSRLLHNILEHTAHHLDMSIPCYRLRQAQGQLAALAPHRIHARPLTWRYYWNVARRCKTYNYTNHEWRPFPLWENAS